MSPSSINTHHALIESGAWDEPIREWKESEAPMDSFYWFLTVFNVGGTAATILYGILVISSIGEDRDQ